ncbi:MAG: hypothetical protein ABSA42_09570 [Terracidiphilus sp.]
MSGFEKDQLETLRDRVEEDFRKAKENYRLDIAAIEHLQRRFFGAVSSIPTSSYSEATIGSNDESPPTILPSRFAPAVPQNDVLDGSIREIFQTSFK